MLSFLPLLGWLLQAPAPPPTLASVYVFLDVDCAASQHVTAELRELYFRYSRQGVGFGGVLARAAATEAEAAAFARTYRLPFVLGRDPGHRLARRLRPRVAPEAVVLAADGRAVIYQGCVDDAFLTPGRRRPARHHDLAAALAALVAGQPVPVPRTEAVGCPIAP